MVLFFALAVPALGAEAFAKPLCPSKLYGEIVAFVDVSVPTDQKSLAQHVPEFKALIRESLKKHLPFLKHEEILLKSAKRRFNGARELRRRGGLECSVLVFEEDKGAHANLLVECLLWSYAEYEMTKATLNNFHARLMGRAPKEQLVADIKGAIRRNITKISDSFKTTRMIYSKLED
jgi:hypothetical protein